MEIHGLDFIGELLANSKGGNPGEILSKEGWISVANLLGALAPVTGDIKYSFSLVDHNGWYRLYSGRILSTLPEPAQSNARALGFTFQLPWADPSQDNQVAGTILNNLAVGGSANLFMYLGV